MDVLKHIICKIMHNMNLWFAAVKLYFFFKEKKTT